MTNKNYEIFDHTADIGLRVSGASLKELFVRSAAALFDILAEAKGQAPQESKEIVISLQADNVEELLVTWLNEFLYLFSVKELIFHTFIIEQIDNTTLKARVSGSSVEGYRINTEIKAATYHALKVEQTPLGWQAEIILDI